MQEPKARAYMSTSKINGIGAHIDRGDDIPTQYSNLGKELDTFREEAYPTAMVEDQDSPEGQNAAKAESLSCKHCGQRFTGTRKNRKSNLRRHMQKKHPDIRRHSRSLSNTPSLPTVRVQDDEETREEHEESSRPVQTHVQGPTRSNRIGVASLLVDPARLTPMRSPASPGKPEDQMEGLTAENHKPNMEPTPAASPLMTTSTTAGASTLSGMSIYPPGQITRFSPRPPAQKPDRDPKKEFKCDIPGCTRATKTFFSLNDLDRHKKSVHEMMPTTGDKRVFVCTGAACNKIDKIWPRLDNFKSHLSRKHPNQNISNLVRE